MISTGAARGDPPPRAAPGRTTLDLGTHGEPARLAHDLDWTDCRRTARRATHTPAPRTTHAPAPPPAPARRLTVAIDAGGARMTCSHGLLIARQARVGRGRRFSTGGMADGWAGEGGGLLGGQLC